MRVPPPASPIRRHGGAQPLTRPRGRSWDHSYHYLYSKYLAPVRQESLRLLEIGLGARLWLPGRAAAGPLQPLTGLRARVQAATWGTGRGTAWRCACCGAAPAQTLQQGPRVRRAQLWKRYMPNTKVSFLEYDAACANKHKVNIEAQSKGTLYIGELPLQRRPCLLDSGWAWLTARGGLQATRPTRRCCTTSWPTPPPLAGMM